MKAIILKEAGGIENLSVANVPLPEAQPKEVLVKVHSFAINPVDMKTRKGGAFLTKLQEQPPVILGWDISGVVEAVGKDVSKFKPGDEVFGMINFPGIGRAYAEYATAPEERLAIKSKNVSHEEAAATTLAALTAWQALVYEAKLEAGQAVLVHAAAGGVGHFAVQIAKHIGAKVFGTASSSNTDFLKEIGVDAAIDYRASDFEDEVGQVDVVLDPLGGEVTGRSIRALKSGGRLISIVGGVKDHLHSMVEEKAVEAKNYLVHSSGSDMRELAKLLETGIIKPYVSQRFALEQVAEAHQQLKKA